ALDVALTQNTPTSPITKTIAGKLSLQGLPELKDGDNTALVPTASPPLYTHSKIMLTGAISAANTSAPLVVRATSTVSIGGTANVSAGNQNGGPGGFNGGDGGAGGTLGTGQAGKMGGGPAGGASAGGAGGWSGMDQVTTLGAPNRGSGGGGGNGGGTLRGPRGGRRGGGAAPAAAGARAATARGGPLAR